MAFSMCHRPKINSDLNSNKQKVLAKADIELYSKYKRNIIFIIQYGEDTVLIYIIVKNTVAKMLYNMT